MENVVLMTKQFILIKIFKAVAYKEKSLVIPVGDLFLSSCVHPSMHPSRFIMRNWLTPSITEAEMSLDVYKLETRENLWCNLVQV